MISNLCKNQIQKNKICPIQDLSEKWEVITNNSSLGRVFSSHIGMCLNLRLDNIEIFNIICDETYNKNNCIKAINRIRNKDSYVKFSNKYF